MDANELKSVNLKQRAISDKHLIQQHKPLFHRLLLSPASQNQVIVVLVLFFLFFWSDGFAFGFLVMREMAE